MGNTAASSTHDRLRYRIRKAGNWAAATAVGVFGYHLFRHATDDVAGFWMAAAILFAFTLPAICGMMAFGWMMRALFSGLGQETTRTRTLRWLTQLGVVAVLVGWVAGSGDMPWVTAWILAAACGVAAHNTAFGYIARKFVS